MSIYEVLHWDADLKNTKRGSKIYMWFVKASFCKQVSWNDLFILLSARIV